MIPGSGQDRSMRTTACNHQYEIAIGILIMTLLMPLILVVNLLLHPAPAPHLEGIVARLDATPPAD